MAIKPLNRKAETLTTRGPDDGRTYSFGDCCPGFLPGWEVGSNGSTIDPCGATGWQSDIRACHPCYWSAQVPDSTSYEHWMDDCGNVATDWPNLCTVPD